MFYVDFFDISLIVSELSILLMIIFSKHNPKTFPLEITLFSFAFSSFTLFFFLFSSKN